MSTRAQVRFIDQSGNASQVYQHKDGYPECTIPNLWQLFRVMGETRTLRGAGYTAANFVFFGKLRSMKMYYNGSWGDSRSEGEVTQPYRDPGEFVAFDSPQFLLGYGIEEVGSWHGDEEWLYEVVIGERSDDAVNIRIASARHIPDSGAADWCFEGTLSEAYDTYCEENEEM